MNKKYKNLIIILLTFSVLITIGYAVTTTWNIWAPMSTTAPLKSFYIYSDSTLKANTQGGQTRTVEFTEGSYDRVYWQFTNGDTRPAISDHTLYQTDGDAATNVTITYFTGGKIGQSIVVRSNTSVIFDKDSLGVGTVNLTTGADDVTVFRRFNADYWDMQSHTDVSQDNN